MIDKGTKSLFVCTMVGLATVVFILLNSKYSGAWVTEEEMNQGWSSKPDTVQEVKIQQSATDLYYEIHDRRVKEEREMWREIHKSERSYDHRQQPYRSPLFVDPYAEE